MSRRRGRVLAFQALYAYEVGEIPVEDLINFSWDFIGKDTHRDKNSEEYLFARLLVTGTIENLSEIDSWIKQYLNDNWEFNRVNKVALTILRISAYSILYQKDISLSIVIDEAINIAKSFGAEDSFKFINAVLDKIGKVSLNEV